MALPRIYIGYGTQAEFDAAKAAGRIGQTGQNWVFIVAPSVTRTNQSSTNLLAIELTGGELLYSSSYNGGNTPISVSAWLWSDGTEMAWNDNDVIETTDDN